jgi:hypothetical protein
MSEDRSRQDAQRYISRVLAETYSKASDKLSVQFGMSDEDEPKNSKELVARIQAGNFVIEKSSSDDDGWGYHPLDGIRWRDPSKTEDKAGFKAAITLLEAQKQTVNDALAVLEPPVALDALNGFRAYVATL